MCGATRFWKAAPSLTETFTARNGLVIRVVYHLGHAVLLEFTRAAGTLTADDVNTLLTSCAGVSNWELGKDSTDTAKLYHRLDGKAVAHWSTEYRRQPARGIRR